VRNMPGAIEHEQDASRALVRSVGSLQEVTAPQPVTGHPGELPALVGVDRSRGDAARDSSG